MKVCKIIDEYQAGLLIGYLFYYEKDDVYSIELNDGVPELDAPIFFSSFYKRNIFTVPPEWSRRWVETRVPPPDRQNLGMILKDCGLRTYDMFRLMMISEGRCSQDDCAVLPVKYENLPGWVIKRRYKMLDFAVRLNEWNMILVFRDGAIFRIDLTALAEEDVRLESALRNPAMKNEYAVMAGGVGILIGGTVTITAEKLYGAGERLPLSAEELRTIARAYIMDTRDVCDELSCSRQYVDQLTKKSGLPVLKDGGARIYARSDVKKITE